jgi:hypothetical protein
MGNFYTNLTLRGPSQQAVAAELKGRSAFVTPPVNGCVVVFDQQSDEQDPKVLSGLGSRLSKKLSCPVLAVMNHDDDVLWFQLYTSGKLADEYNSSPGYFDGDAGPSEPEGGNAEALCRAFGSTKQEQVQAALRKPSFTDDGYAFAIERHADLAGALNLPSYAVGAGFQYVAQGELPEGLTEGDLLKVGAAGASPSS